jgi:hypothetical protein
VENAGRLSHCSKNALNDNGRQLQSGLRTPSRTPIPGLRTRVSDEDEILPHDAMHRRLHEVRTLLDRQRVENLVHRQDMPRHELVETWCTSSMSPS